MSNPGVIVLDSTKRNIFQKIINRNSFRYFQVEDNIGEAIHIHLDDLRIEISIKEFFDICDGFKVAINELVDIKEFNINEVDPLFFKYASKYIDSLEEIKIINVSKNEVKFLLNNNRFNFYKIKNFFEFNEHDLFNVNCEKRSYKFFNQQKNKSYFLKNMSNNFKPILDENFIVRDGKHRLFLKFQDENSTEAYLWRFKNNKFKINLTRYFLLEILNRVIKKIKLIKNKLMQIMQNFIEKYIYIK